jgi:hypothetical protein
MGVLNGKEKAGLKIHPSFKSDKKKETGEPICGKIVVDKQQLTLGGTPVMAIIP